MTQIRLGDLLIRAGVISEPQLQQALAQQQQWGGRLGSQLVRMGALTEDLLVKALAKQLALPRAALGPDDPVEVPQSILERLDKKLCERGGFVPVRYVSEKRTLQIAVSDPFNVVAIDDLSRRVGLRVEPLLAGETQIMQSITRLFGGINESLAGSAVSPFLDNSNRPRDITNANEGPQVGGGPTMPGFVSSGGGNGAARATNAPPAPPAAATTAPAPQPAQKDAGAQGAMTPLTLEQLAQLAQQQQAAARTLAELLLERGVITRAELSAWMGG
jgi:hypothetical protein